ncbi:PAS domain S-box protein [Chroococcus sp. FPU101]|uniref:sensor domain-containing protein n=1 Tax=Chroococcus sp. FPU101 TaxID=1974212 RepID=UPI001A8FF554|nr:PAS domain S-box protein [Chroococcus sp. FPU101]GFE70686.1 diguanylate cyclase/phosphodiesterase with PAS/PAC sensor(s) [Chroococcus sp. FPU101]
MLVKKQASLKVLNQSVIFAAEFQPQIPHEQPQNNREREKKNKTIDTQRLQDLFLGGIIFGTVMIAIGYQSSKARSSGYQQQTEKTLRESEARYRAIIEDQTELICRFLPNGTLTFVNNAYCRYFNKEPSELINHTFLLLIFKEDQEKVTQNIALISLNQPLITHEHRVILNNKICWHQWTNRGIFNAEGQIIEYQAVGRDITLMKEAEAKIQSLNLELEQRVYLRTQEVEKSLQKIQIKEAALRNSETRYQRLVEASPAILYEYSNQRGGIFYSAHVVKVLGYSLAYLARHPWLWSDSIHPEDIKRIKPAVREFYQHGTDFEVEYRIQDAKGKWHWFLDRSIGRRKIENEIIIEGIAIDITEHKESQIALEKAHQQLTFHVENTPLAVIEWDADCKVKYWSSQAKRIFGWEAEEVIGLHWREWNFVPEADRKAVTQIIADLIINKKSRNFHSNRNYTKDGRIIDCEWYNSILLDETGQLISILSLVLDASDRKKTEIIIQQQQELLQTIIDHLPVMINFFNPERNFRLVNQAWEKTLGWKLEEIKDNQFLSECYPDPQDYQTVIDFIQKAEGVWQDFRMTVRDGRTIDASWANVRLSDGSLIGIGQDITERKQMEANLKESETKYRLLFEANPNPLWVYDLETLKFLEVNNAAILHYGYSHEEFLNMTIRDIRPLEDLPLLVQCIESVQPNPDYHYNYGLWRHKKRNGEIIDVEILGQESMFEGRSAEIIMAIDITARLKAEKALSESEERFRRAITDAPFPIIIHAEDGEIIQVNRTWTELSGYTHAEIPTISDWTEKVYGERKEIVKGIIEQLYDIDSRVDEGEFLIKNAIAQERIWNFSSAPLGRLPDGRRLVISMALDITERKRAEERLRYDALHDSVTGLPNRVSLIKQVERCLKQALKQPDYLFAVLFVDLDRFKVVNDSLGHLVGDQLLVAIAYTLENCIHNQGIVSRLGGDEFIILLNQLQDTQEAVKVAQNICTTLESPFTINGQVFFITASIGITFNLSPNLKAIDLLRNADLAMYRAKESGKARYAIFDPEMHVKISRQLKLENSLRVALERQEFLLHYQPIISLQTLTLIGFEALVRWQHPEQGLISPLEFIPIAEETGLIVPLGEWVLVESCRQLKAWQNEFPQINSLQMSVNLSSRQLQQLDLIQTIDSILTRTGLASRYLKLEITESLLMQNPEMASHTLLQLQEKQIQISIDDFGTGYSSLSYLHRLPVNTLKIDRSFVSRMNQDQENLDIVEAIINLAHHLKIDVVAEGVETQEHFTKLQELGCEYGQGYFFSRPMNTENIKHYLQEQP